MFSKLMIYLCSGLSADRQKERRRDQGTNSSGDERFRNHICAPPCIAVNQPSSKRDAEPRKEATQGAARQSLNPSAASLSGPNPNPGKPSELGSNQNDIRPTQQDQNEQERADDDLWYKEPLVTIEGPASDHRPRRWQVVIGHDPQYTTPRPPKKIKSLPTLKTACPFYARSYRLIREMATGSKCFCEGPNRFNHRRRFFRRPGHGFRHHAFKQARRLGLL